MVVRDGGGGGGGSDQPKPLQCNEKLDVIFKNILFINDN